MISAMLHRIFERIQFAAATRSWKLYQSQSFVVDDRGLRIPVSNGVGLDMIGEGRHPLMDVVEWTYARKRGTFIDIGANVGRVLVALARFDRSIPYIGFEPQLKGAAHIDTIIRVNGLLQTHSILPIGLGDTPRTATLLSNSDSDVSATINVDTRPEEQF